LETPLQLSSVDDARAHRLAWGVWPADLGTPVQLFLSLRARGHHLCLLESVEGPARLARYSFLGVDARARFRAKGRRSLLATPEQEFEFEGAAHEGLRQATQRLPLARPPPGLPPFCGGWVGWFAYEWSSVLEPTVPRAACDPWGVPDASFDLYEDLLAIDHAAQKLFVVCACPRGAEGFPAARERVEELARDAFGPSPSTGTLTLDGEAQPTRSKSSFEGGVESLRSAILKGDCFQAVLSQRFELGAQGDPFALYRVLRIANPSPHMFFFEADGVTLIGSSPERLVWVRGRHAETRPIAGTRPRSEDALEDERLAAQLCASAKERAEHDMLVDLARNDLGRVARIGSVRVREHASLERFARVMHLVSRVECELATGQDALGALAACFPAGTVSGAPKVRAMQLVAELEGETRGPYAGVFGYLDGRGDLDMALVIRSFVLKDGRLTVQAGAGIVAESDPEREYLETLDKARGLFDAARMAAALCRRGGERRETIR
jgi:anthranilate synthase component I